MCQPHKMVEDTQTIGSSAWYSKNTYFHQSAQCIVET